MSTLTDIEDAISKLDRDEFEQLRYWLHEYEKDAWDRQMEADAAEGKLDDLAMDALREFHAGQTRPLPTERAEV